ncbi:MAG TPA: hypothetical protein VM055_08680 [Novosphingobium sp.]|nr:hypothetical protein [Novosphingobium sp.]
MGRIRAFFRLINPIRALGDLGHELARPVPHRWPLMGVAAAATFAVFSVMFQEGFAGMPRPPEVIYIESWREGRSDAEIIAGNIAATQARKVREAEEAASAERVRQMYKALGRASGMDVDAIEARARAERAAEAKAKAAVEAARPKPRVAPVGN